MIADLWKKDRKLLAPAFNIKILLSFIPIFNEKTNVMVKNMEIELNTNKSFDVFKYLFECTLDMVIGKCKEHIYLYRNLFAPFSLYV